MPKRKKLADLFQVGKPLTISESVDGEVFEETVWLQKLNSVELDKAWRKANAVRARLLTAKTDTDSDDYLSMLSEVMSMGDDDDALINYVLAPERAKAIVVCEAEHAAEDEWSESEYLQGLRDAWNGGVKDDFARDPEDPDAKRVFEELKRFANGVDVLVEQEMANKRASYDNVAIEDVRAEATDVCIDNNASQEWAREYNRMEVFLGTRDPEDHAKRYFATRDEVDTLSPLVLGRLQREFESMRIDVLEGKGLVETRASSPSSAQPAEEETPDSSGLVDATT